MDWGQETQREDSKDTPTSRRGSCEHLSDSMKLTTTLILLLMALEWRKIALSDIRQALKHRGQYRLRHLSMAKQSAAHSRNLLATWQKACGFGIARAS